MSTTNDVSEAFSDFVGVCETLGLVQNELYSDFFNNAQNEDRQLTVQDTLDGNKVAVTLNVDVANVTVMDFNPTTGMYSFHNTTGWTVQVQTLDLNGVQTVTNVPHDSTISIGIDPNNGQVSINVQQGS